MNSNIEIRILNDLSVTKYVSIIRNYTKESIADIKNKIISSEVVMHCEYIEHPNELVKIYAIMEKLQDNGAQIEIIRNFEGMSKIIDMATVKNIINKRKIIEKQVYEDMERELEQ